MAFDWTHLIPGYDAAKGVKDYFFDKPAAQAKAGDTAGMGISTAGTQQLMDFYAKQQARSQAQFKPLQDMFAASYGTKGLQAPQLPGAGPGKPLRSMYGGG